MYILNAIDAIIGTLHLDGDPEITNVVYSNLDRARTVLMYMIGTIAYTAKLNLSDPNEQRVVEKCKVIMDDLEKKIGEYKNEHK